MRWTQLSGAETAIIVLISILIWLIYSIFAFRKAGYKEGTLRSVFLAFSLVFVGLIIFRPGYATEKPTGGGILLTEDVEAIPDSLPVFALPNVKIKDQVIQVPDIIYIERNHPEINQLYISGNDLKHSDLKQLKRIQTAFAGDIDLSGFTWINYNRHLKEGEKLQVSGTYINNAADTINLKLITAEDTLDSVYIPSGTHSFFMQGRVEISGNYLGRIAVQREDSIRYEPLPYTVKPKKKLRIIILQSYPSFEMNYLKDWLAHQQHSIQGRVQISRNKFATQYINLEKRNPNLMLSEENLNETDIIIADAASIRQLNNLEQRRLRQAVNEGLGILMLPDASWIRNPVAIGENFSLNASPHNDFIPEGITTFIQKNSLKKLPVQFVEMPVLVPIIRSQKQEIVAVYIPKGTGRIGSQLVLETFPWILKGKRDLYNNFWTDLINMISRRESAHHIQFSDLPFLWEHDVNQLFVNDTSLNKISFVNETGNEMFARPKIALNRPFESSFPFISSKEGWVKIVFSQDQFLNEYVLPAAAWKDLKQAFWWRKNQQFASNTTFEFQKYNAFEEVPLIWWYTGFILAISFLWWREKGDLRKAQRFNH